ncbi:MAG: spore coat protein U domain-containing protein [Ramlibacter sp.]|nr:spore coat protein U domain-containing protein [Ramlibacter sp.]
MTPRSIAAGLLLVLALCAASPSQALDTCAVLPVVTVQPPTPGPYNGSEIVAVGSITVTCVAVLGNVGYTINMDYGSNASGTQRRMRRTGVPDTWYLPYEITCDDMPNTPWVDGTGGTCHVVKAAGGVVLSLQTVHYFRMRIPAGATLYPGTYTDTIGITVLY